MTLSDLPAATMEQIKRLRYDRIREKHEGPEDWSSVLEYYDPEILQIDGRNVLLPIGKDQHPQITILRTSPGADGDTLVIFLKDMTYVHDPTEEFWFAGFFAFCERLPETDLYIASVYHEWFMVPPIRQQLQLPSTP